MSNNQKVLQVFIQHRMFDNYSHLVEIEHALRIWNYLDNRILPYEIDAVMILINEKWVLDGDNKFIMTREEYLQFLEEYNLNKISNESELKKLAEYVEDTTIYFRE